VTVRLKVNAAHPYEVVVGHGVSNELDGLLDGVARAAIIHPPTLRARAEELRNLRTGRFERDPRHAALCVQPAGIGMVLAQERKHRLQRGRAQRRRRCVIEVRARQGSPG